jgi:hypothetical protein
VPPVSGIRFATEKMALLIEHRVEIARIISRWTALGAKLPFIRT